MVGRQHVGAEHQRAALRAPPPLASVRAGLRTGHGALDGHWITAVAMTLPLVKNLAAVALVLAAPRWYLRHRREVHAAFMAIFVLGLVAEDFADRESGQVRRACVAGAWVVAGPLAFDPTHMLVDPLPHLCFDGPRTHTH